MSQRVLKPRAQSRGLRRAGPRRVHPGVEQRHQVVRIGRIGGQDPVCVAGTQRRSRETEVTEHRPQQPDLPGGEPGGEHQRVEAVAVDVSAGQPGQDVAQPVHLADRRVGQFRGCDHVVLVHADRITGRVRMAGQRAVGHRSQTEVGQDRHDVGDGGSVGMPGEPHDERGVRVVGQCGGKAGIPVPGQPGQGCFDARTDAVVGGPVTAGRLAYHPSSIAQKRSPTHAGNLGAVPDLLICLDVRNATSP